MSLPGTRRVVQLMRWLRRSAAVVIACASAIILGYAAGVFVADINDSNASAPPPARNPIIDTVVTPSRSSFPWLAVLVPLAFVALIALFRKRRPVRWLLHRAKTAAETYALPLPPELSATVVVNQSTLETTDQSDGSVGSDNFSPLVNARARAVVLPVAIAPSEPAPPVDEDGCIICVLTFRDEPPVDQASKRTMTVARGVAASHLAIVRAFRNGADAPGARADAAQSNRQIVDVISIFGVSQAMIELAYEASEELGRFIEHDYGFRLLVSNNRPSPSRTAANDAPPGGETGTVDEGESAVLFMPSATQVDLHGLVPLAVYARVDLLAAAAVPTPVVPTEPAAAEAVVESAPTIVPVQIVAADVAAVDVSAVDVAAVDVVAAQDLTVLPVVSAPPVPLVPSPVSVASSGSAVLDDADQRKICTMFDMLNELLAMGDSPQHEDQLASSR